MQHNDTPSDYIVPGHKAMQRDTNSITSCDTQGPHSNLLEDLCLLGYSAVAIGKQPPKFHMGSIPPTFRLHRSKNNSMSATIYQLKEGHIREYMEDVKFQTIITFKKFQCLTLSCRKTYTYIYIYMSYRTANLQMLHFIYYSTNIRTEYFKHAAHYPFFFLFKMPFIS